MMNWLRILIAGLALQCQVIPALANFAMSPSGSTTAFAIDAANQGTALCAAASTECSAHVLINTAGAPVGISGSPLFVQVAAGAAAIGTVRTLGNAGGIFDGATAAAVPANVIYTGINNGGNLAGWSGLNNGGVNYGLVGVVDNTGSQLNGYTTGTAGSASAQFVSVQGGTGMTPVVTVPSSLFPNGAITLTGNSTGTTGAVVGTLGAASGVTTYICGFNVSALGGTAAVGPITVAGLVGSSMVFQLSSLAGGANFTQQFFPCVPASAVNTAITITTTADGSASAVDVNSWGFRL